MSKKCIVNTTGVIKTIHMILCMPVIHWYKESLSKIIFKKTAEYEQMKRQIKENPYYSCKIFPLKIYFMK